MEKERSRQGGLGLAKINVNSECQKSKINQVDMTKAGGKSPHSGKCRNADPLLSGEVVRADRRSKPVILDIFLPVLLPSSDLCVHV
jgi:hypothetical protein